MLVVYKSTATGKFNYVILKCTSVKVVRGVNAQAILYGTSQALCGQRGPIGALVL